MGACCDTNLISDPFGDTLIKMNLRKLDFQTVNQRLESFNQKFSKSEYYKRMDSNIFLPRLSHKKSNNESNSLIVEMNYEKLLEYTNEIIESTSLEQYRFFNEMYLLLDLKKEKILLALVSLIQKPKDVVDSGRILFDALSFGNVNERIPLNDLLEKMSLYLNLNILEFTKNLAEMYKVPVEKLKDFNPERLLIFEDSLFKRIKSHFARVNQTRNISQEVNYIVHKEDFAEFTQFHPFLLNFESLRYVYCIDVSLEKH